VRFDRISPAPFSLDIGTSENLVLNANGGNDSFSATGDLASLIKITVDGGAGDDTLLGSNGIDLLLGGDNNDFIDGQQGGDTAFMGAGDDTFQWDPGDGSDTVEGQAGNDRLLFNGSPGAEIFEALVNGPWVRFTRNLGNIVDGGTGNDIQLGGAGGDTLLGGDNDDVLLGGGGIDGFDGGAGENIVIQDGSGLTTGIVSVFGDALDNTITISRDAGGNILSNGVAIPGATVANTGLIRVFGLGGNDTLTIDEALPTCASRIQRPLTTTSSSTASEGRTTSSSIPSSPR
jgi:Ca2+-binding RTX toxin-like protein